MTKAAPNAAAIAEHLNNEAPKIHVMPELRDLIEPPSEVELKELEISIKQEGGARDPIVIWKETGAIVDGHNRHRICTANELPFKTMEMSFVDLEAVKEWMLRNQLGRRNLSPFRVEYYIGKLYDMQKQPTDEKRQKMEGKNTAQEIGETFGVSERTVRRAADMAKGVDAVGRVLNVTSVLDKINAVTKKNAEEGTNFTKEELQVIGKEADPVVQEEAVRILANIKKGENKAKAAVKAATEKAKDKGPYSVVFCTPDFGRGVVKPELAQAATLYMAVNDEDMPHALDLLKKWNFDYQGSFVFNTERYESTFSNVVHTFLIVATKGNVTTPKKASNSLINEKGAAEEQMIKLIEQYHPTGKRLDMREKRTAKGWDSLKS